MSGRVRAPVLAHQVGCSCGAIFEYPRCTSGFGDFETYVGLRTRTVYRLDLGSVQYLSKAREELLHDARQTEGTLLRVPDELTCGQCGRSVAECTVLGRPTEVIELITVIE